VNDYNKKCWLWVYTFTDICVGFPIARPNETKIIKTFKDVIEDYCEQADIYSDNGYELNGVLIIKIDNDGKVVKYMALKEAFRIQKLVEL
jgi:hypothetical protein